MNALLCQTYRILSFDPGSRTLGMAVQELDLSTFKTQLKTAETLHVDKFTDTDSFYERLRVIREYVRTCCKLYAPAAISIELPYMGSRPQAYGALKETILTMKQACREWRPHCALFLYEPSRIKKVNGVPGNSGDKTLMRKALLSSVNIDKPKGLVEQLDEHAIDAVMIGYAHVHIGILKKDRAHEQRKRDRKRNRRKKAKQQRAANKSAG